MAVDVLFPKVRITFVSNAITAFLVAITQNRPIFCDEILVVWEVELICEEGIIL